jgi:peptidoglycan hydrolase-like protein with peptidoglycan-binding domain
MHETRSKEEPVPDPSYRQPGLTIRKEGSGVSNRQLRDLQRDLRRLGYLRSGIDGNFGDQTALAVKGLQHDLLEGATLGNDGTPSVVIKSYNAGRVTAVTGEVDQALVACIADMLADANFATLPFTPDPAGVNRKVATQISTLPSSTVPTAFLMAILTQESGLRHFHQPAPGDEDTFITVGLDRNVKGAPHIITSRGYGAGQYTLFHHPPRPSEVTDFMLDVGKNLRKATGELRDKLDHFILGSTPGTHSDDRTAKFGDTPLRLCKFTPDDPRYMTDCKQCVIDARRRDIQEGQTPLYEGSADVFEPTQYYDMSSPAYQNAPLAADVGCDWPYAVRRYNGSGLNSYHYQVRVLQHLLAL